MAVATTQLDLTLEPADDDLVPRWCPYCGKRLAAPNDAGLPDYFAVFRAHRRRHHGWGPDVDDDADETLGEHHYTGVDGEPLELGKLYDMTLAYTVEYRFRVAGRSQSDAERRAKDWQLDATPADKFHVHTDAREVATFTEADAEIPAYLDPNAGEDEGDG